MIELPEAINFAKQMTRELNGRTIAEAVRGNSPHKFAFYNHEAEAYPALLNGRALGETRADGGFILTEVKPSENSPACILGLGCGGERIVLHPNEKTLPKKHQFLLHFSDGAYLTVTIQMWGMIKVLEEGEPPMGDYHPAGPSPVSDGFTLDYFTGLWSTLEADDKRSVKFFLISKPGITGVGNGYTQDILFRAGLDPRHRAAELGKKEKKTLYDAIRETLLQAVALGGRDDEIDLYGCPGKYPRILSSKSVGQPCPVCGSPIQKIQFLGGASYFCGECQR